MWRYYRVMVLYAAAPSLYAPLSLNGWSLFVSGGVGTGHTGGADAVDGDGLGCGWRNWSNVSPEGNLNRFPDSKNSVRQSSGFMFVTSLPIGNDKMPFDLANTLLPGCTFRHNLAPADLARSAAPTARGIDLAYWPMPSAPVLHCVGRHAGQSWLPHAGKPLFRIALRIATGSRTSCTSTSNSCP